MGDLILGAILQPKSASLPVVLTDGGGGGRNESLMVVLPSTLASWVVDKIPCV